MRFEDVLTDTKTFTDEMEITIGNEKVKLGDIRDLSKREQAKVSEQMNALNREREDVKSLATKAAELQQTLQAQIDAAQESGNKKPPTDDEFEADPFWTPARKKLSAIAETQKKLDDTVKQLATAVGRAVTIWGEDRFLSQFDRVKDRLKGDKYKDWTYEKVRDYAAENKLLDKHGLPSVERAVLELTKGDELERIKKEALEEGKRLGMQQARMNAMPRPTSATGPAPRGDETAVAKHGLEGLGDDVANDRELMDMLARLGTVGPEDFVQ